MANSTAQADLKCTVISCPNTPNRISTLPALHFFDFPDDQEIKSKWKEKCGIAANHNTSGAQVCSAHFKPVQCINKRNLKPDAVPTENLGWMVGESLASPVIQAVYSTNVEDIKPEPQPTSPPRPKPSFNAVKEAVDENNRLQEHLTKLKAEEENARTKQKSYEKKIISIGKEIETLHLKLNKMSRKTRRDGVVETNNLIGKVFSQAQINLLLRKKKVIWSPDDLAMAFTLRHLGNKECYLYLKDTLNIPLPSLSCVQRWFASNTP